MNEWVGQLDSEAASMSFWQPHCLLLYRTSEGTITPKCEDVQLNGCMTTMERCLQLDNTINRGSAQFCASQAASHPLWHSR